SAVSEDSAWQLFDRSIHSSFTPDDRPVVVSFDRAKQISAVKVFGSAPYVLEIHGASGDALGFEPVDLSSQSAGWHVFSSIWLRSTKAVELRFHPTGAPGQIPELELWEATDDPRIAKVDLATGELPAEFVSSAGTTEADELSPGNCAVFGVTLSRPAFELRRAHLIYE